MENIQTLLVVVVVALTVLLAIIGIQVFLVVALTVLLAIIGIQVFLVVRDLRKIMRRVNALLEDSIIGGGLIRPDKITGILELLRRKKKMHTHGEGETPVN